VVGTTTDVDHICARSTQASVAEIGLASLAANCQRDKYFARPAMIGTSVVGATTDVEHICARATQSPVL